MKEITIIGGGLAGLSLAVGLRKRGVACVVHEAGRYPRHRVCGEFISGVGLETLEALGISDDLADAERCGSMVWHREGCRVLEGELPVPALGISRHRLDRRLRDRAEAWGVRVIESSRWKGAAEAGQVWAAGRRMRKSGWLGLKCHVLDLELEADLEMHLGSNGYVGLARIEDGRVNVCGLFRLDRTVPGNGSDRMIGYLRRGGNEALARRIETARRDEKSFLGVAGFEPGWEDQPSPGCRIGDALGMIPPFTGNGMSMAFESAELAIDPLVSWSRGGSSWDDATHQIGRIGRKRFRRRIASGMAIQRVLMNARGRDLIEILSRRGVLPWKPLLALVR